MTLTTYYPAPYGAYNQIIATGQTVLARDAGNVGIGTSSPATKLDVNGVVRVGNYAAASSGVNGGIYYDTTAQSFLGSWMGGSRLEADATLGKR